ncbi:MAG: hypothetical protein AUJ21_01300 [Anaerolineae bacterium CG1_02_58_13]|nr:MAG: hypothetical protein AUJ21_01300 [Anaerolineae bacterium CG1_02_58_13]
MSEARVLEIQQGIWIEEKWLQNAGLGQRLQVVVKPGEIRILSLPAETDVPGSAADGWTIFRSLGQDASRGRLSNAAVEHDRYLYGKKQ